MTIALMVAVIMLGSAVSLLGGALLFTTKKRRQQAIMLAMPFGAGALLAAAFFDLLPEAFEMGSARELLLWMLCGFLVFFLVERVAGWFHRHHEHEDITGRHESQRRLIVFGDFAHNAIDGAAIGAAFVANPVLGIITTIAVSAHEIPKELGTFALLLSRGWRDKTALLANILTAVATIVVAVIVYLLGSSEQLPIAILLAVTAGFFVYIAASDIIPDIHEQPRRPGMIQAGMLILGVVLVGSLITLLHSAEPHVDHETDGAESHIREVH